MGNTKSELYVTKDAPVTIASGSNIISPEPYETPSSPSSPIRQEKDLSLMSSPLLPQNIAENAKNFSTTEIVASSPVGESGVFDYRDDDVMDAVGQDSPIGREEETPRPRVGKPVKCQFLLSNGKKCSRNAQPTEGCAFCWTHAAIAGEGYSCPVSKPTPIHVLPSVDRPRCSHMTEAGNQCKNLVQPFIGCTLCFAHAKMEKKLGECRPKRSPKKSPKRSPKKSPKRSPKKSPKRSPKKSRK
jgi:hypothetical protein